MYKIAFLICLLFPFWNLTQKDEKLKTITIDKKDIEIISLDSLLKETSSLFYSNQLLWSNNDDKDNHLYGINPKSGAIEQTIQFTKLKVIDWEETQEDSNYFYLGDFGNNGKGNRQNLRIFKIRKTDFNIDTIQFHYPEQTDFSVQKSNSTDFDCEAFIVSDSCIYLFSKEWKSMQTTLYKIPNKKGKFDAKKIARLDVGGLITGATINQNRDKIMLSGYSKTLSPFLMYLSDFKGDCFFQGTSTKLMIPRSFLQVEGITFIEQNKIVISNEKFNKAFINHPQSLTIINLTDYLK